MLDLAYFQTKNKTEKKFGGISGSYLNFFYWCSKLIFENCIHNKFQIRRDKTQIQQIL